MPGGRPLKFQSVEDLQAQIDAYFTACDLSEKPYTITGLAMALGTYRETLCNYEKRDEYLDTIKQAKQRCESYVENLLLTGGCQAAAAIFALKNYRWTDKQEHVHEGNPDKPMKWEVEIICPK